MPVTYDFVCDNDECGYVQVDVLCSDGKPVGEHPQHCGRPMYMSFQNLSQGISEFIPFTTRNIHPDGKPLLVRNKGDLKRYYREYGVVHYDDPNLEAQGSEIVRKTPKIGKVFDMGHRR